MGVKQVTVVRMYGNRQHPKPLHWVHQTPSLSVNTPETTLAYLLVFPLTMTTALLIVADASDGSSTTLRITYPHAGVLYRK